MSKKINHIFYRPAWTCGRYNSKHKVAIYYNLIDGVSYFFEAESAEVVGKIIDAGKLGKIDIDTISKELNIASECLATFFSELENLALVVRELPQEFEIDEYRRSAILAKYSTSSNAIESREGLIIGKDSEAEQAYIDAVGKDVPIISMVMELTYRCSEKCIHCYNIGATRNDDEVCRRSRLAEMSKADIFRIIDELYEMGTISISLSGGDPFSHKDVWDILEYLYEKDFAITILTNGYNISNDSAPKRLAKLFPKRIQISLYSSEPDVHDFITRTSGSFLKTMQAIENLSRTSLPLSIACCIMKPNIKTYQGVKDIADRYNASIGYDINITDSIDGDLCASLKLRLDKEQYQLILQDSNLFSCIDSNNPDTFKKRQFDPCDNFCGAGEATFTITPDGNLIPCPAFHLVFGNVKINTIESILAKSEDYKKWLTITSKDYAECGSHDYCQYCSPCPGNNFTNTGSYLLAGENNCFEAKCRFNLASKVIEGYKTLDRQGINTLIQEMDDYSIQRLNRIDKRVNGSHLNIK